MTYHQLIADCTVSVSSHSTTISTAHSRSKSISSGYRSTPPLPTFIKAVSRTSSTAELKRNGEIGQPCLIPLLEWNNGERRLYALTVSEVFVCRVFKMLLNSGTPFN
ncbi:unnamed protein product [Schistosoma margrebowiei]|uniref:Uncharacterized protein n=1 Tax=Schistosoma margrebowiei TaxID=48269 RepID=A0A3P8DNL0_9TREM|nr:unnamed protein product [Schistosoma margrebowiei]